MRAAILLFASIAVAQTQPEISSHESTVTFSSRVNMVSVPVVVRDVKGAAVGTLQQDDFQLFDKGKVQTITKFSLEKSEGSAGLETSSLSTDGSKPAAAPKPALPERYVAYLVDDIHLHSSDLLQTRIAMNKHLDAALEAKSRAAIVTTTGRMLADFTDDREKLRKAVNSILPWSSGPDSQQDCTVRYYLADYLTNQSLYFSGFLFTDEQIAALAAGGSDPILSAVVDEMIGCMGGKLPDVIRPIRAEIHRSMEFGDNEINFSLGALKDVVRRLSAMPGSRTIVLVSPGFLVNVNHRTAEYDVLDKAIRANVTVNTIDMRGLFTIAGMSDASQRGYFTSSPGALMQAAISEASADDDVLAELADGTGGTFFHNDNGLKEGLNLLAARPEYIYVLGFSPQDLKYDGTYHELKVKLRNSRGMTLQVRKGYWAPKHATDADEEASDEIREAVFSREEIHDIPVEVQTEFFKSSEEKAELTVTGRLDASALRFKQANDRNNDTVTVVAGLFDSNGNYVSGIRRVMELHLKDQTMAGVQTSGIRIKETFNVAPGRYIVRMVVWDGEGKTMAAHNAGVEIP
jgi:VWFA-related protein